MFHTICNCVSPAQVAAGKRIPMVAGIHQLGILCAWRHAALYAGAALAGVCDYCSAVLPYHEHLIQL
jgi:hypothetical protein